MSQPVLDPGAPVLTDHFTILVHAFDHGLPLQGDLAPFMTRAYAGGWRSWLWGEVQAGTTAKKLAADMNYLRKWFHSPALKALFPEMHCLEGCREHLQDLCHPGGLPLTIWPMGAAQEECRERLAGELMALAQGGPIGLATLANAMGAGGVLRLTLSLAALDLPDLWRFSLQKWDGTTYACFFRLDRLDAYLFPHGLGFCGCKVTLLDENYQPETQAERLVTFWQRVRDFDDQAKFTPVAPAAEGPQADSATKPACRWISNLLAPLTQGAKSRPDRSFRFKIFACLSLAPDTPRPGWWEETIGHGYYQGLLYPDIFLYEAATTTIPGSCLRETPADQAWQPSRQYLAETLLRHNLIDIWRYWKGLALKDLVVFLQQDLTGQPPQWRYDYYFFPLYIYVYHLKEHLRHLAEGINLARTGGYTDTLAAQFDEFYHFRNDYWFSEISPNFQMAILFEKFKLGLEVQADYQTVLDEVNDLYHLQTTRFTQEETKASGRLNRWVMVLTVGALFTGIMGMNSIIEENHLTTKALIESLSQFFQAHSFLIFSSKDLLGLLVNVSLGLVFSGVVWLIYKLLVKK